MTKEMREVIYSMLEELVINDCEGCPFAEQCQKEELWWGCSVWEDAMGEDL